MKKFFKYINSKLKFFRSKKVPPEPIPEPIPEPMPDVPPENLQQQGSTYPPILNPNFTRKNAIQKTTRDNESKRRVKNFVLNDLIGLSIKWNVSAPNKKDTKKNKSFNSKVSEF